MRANDIQTLFEFNYWANRQLLSVAADVPPDLFVAQSTFTWRNLRDTLVHTLDVEWSWRIRLRGVRPELWETSLDPADYPDVATLANRWASDEVDMRAWIWSLTEGDLAAVVDLGGKDRFPLWYFLVHIVTHSEQQRRDAQMLLRHHGQSVPDLEFLYFADTLTTGA